MRLLLTFCILLGMVPFCFSQNAQDKAIPMQVTLSEAPAAIQLTWPVFGDNATYSLKRKEKGTAAWTAIFTNEAIQQFLDSTIEIGRHYEYQLLRIGNGLIANGYISAGIRLPVTDNRGKLLLIIDSNLMPLATSIDRLKKDIGGDGWDVLTLTIDPAVETVPSIKEKIMTAYNEAPSRLKALFLLGNIPVPYSGNLCPDGHPDHCGAWPADGYYADMDGIWTDNSVNTTNASRPENQNVPGDGKFDQTQLPSALELEIGRVDFTRLNPATFGVENRLVLYQRYLDKNHAFRQGQYRPARRALVDDNFGYFGGEAFAANGWRNGYALVGVDNVFAGDFQNDTDSLSYLWAYGCGGGWYQGAGGVGSTASFAADSINAVFTMLFGSYHGDWDSPDNFMIGALANRGPILTCSWAGRPNWYYHHMALGENIGYSARLTQNNGQSLTYNSPGSGNGMVHVALMGDPTLRAYYPTPPINLIVNTDCNQNELMWTAISETTMTGFHIYRKTPADTSWVRLSDQPITDFVFADTMPPQDAIYEIRKVVLEHSPTGSFYNQSTGLISEEILRPAVLQSGTSRELLDCLGNTRVTVAGEGGTPPYEYQWSDGTSGNQAIYSQGAAFSVTTTDASGCESIHAGTIGIYSELILALTFTDESAPGANDGTATAQATGGTGLITYHWSTGENSPTISNLSPGNYSVTITDALGCETKGEVTIGTLVGLPPGLNQTQIINVFPNPVSEELSIQVAMEEVLSISIVNSLGNVVHQFNTTKEKKLYRMNVHGFSPGIYWILVQDQDGSNIVCKQIVIMH